MKLGARFALTTSLAAAVVLGIASMLLYNATRQATENVRAAVIRDTMQLTSEVDLLDDLQIDKTVKIYENGMRRYRISHEKGDAYVFELGAGPGRSRGQSGGGEGEENVGPLRLVVPLEDRSDSEDLLGLIMGIVLAVLVAVAIASFVVGKQISRPLEKLVNDIRQISRGDFNHRTLVKAGGEIALLARTVDRMAASLEEAQEAEIEFGMKEREMEVAGEVREALLPQTTPAVAGYDIAGEHMGSPEPGGDFHDFVETEDGHIGLLVCGVSGKGVPGALVGATARAYLRSELAGAGGDVAGAFKRVNRSLAGDVRRGMYVTAIYALLDPDAGTIQVACAGHKVPLIRYSAADGKLHKHQPEGIALGFDAGPVFDRGLEVATFQLERGDHIILANTGPAEVQNAEGEAVGANGFYRLLMRLVGETSEMMLDGVMVGLESHAIDEPFPNDISLMTVRREA